MATKRQHSWKATKHIWFQHPGLLKPNGDHLVHQVLCDEDRMLSDACESFYVRICPMTTQGVWSYGRVSNVSPACHTFSLKNSTLMTWTTSKKLQAGFQARPWTARFCTAATFFESAGHVWNARTDVLGLINLWLLCTFSIRHLQNMAVDAMCKPGMCVVKWFHASFDTTRWNLTLQHTCQMYDLHMSEMKPGTDLGSINPQNAVLSINVACINSCLAQWTSCYVSDWGVQIPRTNSRSPD